MALRLYAEDNDARLPPAHVWSDAIRDQLRSQDILICPQSATKASYAFFQDLDGRRTSAIPNAADQPMAYDSTLIAPNATDHGESFTRRHPVSGGPFGNVAYADGHIKRAKSLWPPPARSSR